MRRDARGVASRSSREPRAVSRTSRRPNVTDERAPHNLSTPRHRGPCASGRARRWPAPDHDGSAEAAGGPRKARRRDRPRHTPRRPPRASTDRLTMSATLSLAKPAGLAARSARVTAPPPRVASPPLARAPRRDALPPRSGARTRRCTATRRSTLRSASVFSACPRRPSARSHPDPARPSPPRALPAARRALPANG